MNNKRTLTRINLSELLPTGEYAKKIMQERSSILSKIESHIQSVSIKNNNYIVFKMGEDQFYGVQYVDIMNIEPIHSITKVPNVPEYIAGVYYWHGKIISVLHLSVFLNVSEKTSLENSYVVVVQHRDTTIGLLFNDVVGINNYGDDEIQPPLAEIINVDPKYVQGIHGENICILNIKNIMTDISLSLMNNQGDKHEITT